MLSESAMLCCCCCCAEVGAACRRLLGPRKVAKLNYLAIVLAFILPVLLVTYLLDEVTRWVNLTPSQVVARCSFSLLLLFLLMLLVVACRNKVSMVINEGLFTLKYFIVLSFFLLSLLLKSGLVEAYSQMARILSLAYVVIQIVILIDLFYIAGNRLVRRYDEGEEECGGILVGLSVIFTGGAISLNILAYIHFNNDECTHTLWLNILVSLLLFLMPFVQILQLNSQNNLLTTSFVALLVSYYAYSAQISSPNCTSRLSTSRYIFNIVAELFLFVLATYGTIWGGLSEEEETERVGSEAEQDLLAVQEYSQKNSWLKWHCYMCLAAIYLCMVFSNWLAIENVGSKLLGSDFAFGVRAGMSIGTAVIYVWTMIAPVLLKNRNFQLQQ